MSENRVKRLLSGQMPFEYILYKLCRSNSFFMKLIFTPLYKSFFSKEKNFIFNEIQKINIETYDGFNQATHLDVIKYGNYTYLISTSMK